MKRITPRRPDIKLYEDGFDAANDMLERKPTGVALSDLVERIEEPMVIALDGGWGTGKSFFLQCWVGEHLKVAEHQAQTVYFDAFRHDFIDEPLVSLMGVIEERFADVKDPTWETRFSKVKGFAKKLVKPAIRIGAFVGTAGVSELAVAAIGSDTLDKAADAALDRLCVEASDATDELWKNEADRRQAMGEFRASLIELTKPQEGSDKPRKLVIVVDELDRCRPDYALSLLEIIKHFFDVPNVHFVLGANMRELENSVSARYGSGIDAGLYLQKFVTLTMRLPAYSASNRNYSNATKYLDKISAEMGIDQSYSREVNKVISIVKKVEAVSLRGIERLASFIAVSRRQTNTSVAYEYDLTSRLAVSLTIMKAWFPETYDMALNGTLKMSDLEKIFEFPETSSYEEENFTQTFQDEWNYYLHPTIYDVRHPQNPGSRKRSRQQGLEMLRSHVTELLETFAIT